jgi:outer membrane protein OmpA-like peptidoglycan-associated protein
MKTWKGVLAVPVALALVASSGCVTKKVFRTTVAEQDQKIDTVQGGVEANEKRIKDVDDKTKVEVSRLDAKAEAARARGDEAYNKAENAEKLARGKVVWEVTLNNDEVKFGLNQAKISDSAQAALDDIAQRVKSSDHAVYVEIQGHTDNTGSAEYNMNLGQKRADAVRRYLGDEAGIPLHLITAISYGEDSPVADNKNKDGRAQNRRVVIRILE